MIEEFRKRLDAAGAGTWGDPRRTFSQADYLSLILFGLLNPVVETMRGLCAATHLQRVQQDVCPAPMSLGSLSEAQAVIEEGLLEKVFLELAAEHSAIHGDPRLLPYRDKLMAIDGTLWAALPRMSWALWRWQHGRESAVKLHLKFNLLEEKPAGAVIAPAKRCERAVLRENLKSGEFYVGDRYYGEHYAFFDEMKEEGCGFVLRLRQEAAFEVIEEYALTDADRSAGVSFDGWVRLGRGRKPTFVRLVRVPTEGGELLLVTDKPREELCAELVALIYRYRWRIELFFKWIKCILGCRHWLAESPRGVAVQIYCALIAALLLFRLTGRKPNKRAMEMIRFYLLGYADIEELSAALGIGHLEKKSR